MTQLLQSVSSKAASGAAWIQSTPAYAKAGECASKVSCVASNCFAYVSAFFKAAGAAAATQFVAFKNFYTSMPKTAQYGVPAALLAVAVYLASRPAAAPAVGK